MKTNIHMYIFLSIAVIAGLTDIFIYIFNLEYIIALILASIVVLTLTLIFKKKKKIEIKTDFEKSDILFFIPIFIITIIYSFCADYWYDTSNYHIYLQQCFFNDKINFDYLPPCGFFFPLADRMFYIVRIIFGYKIGTILSEYSLVVLYYQLKNIFKVIFPNMKKLKRNIISFLPLLTYTVSYAVGTYHIDNFSLIFLLEIFFIIISNENVLKDKKNLYYLFLLAGISIGIKIINLIIVIPFAIFGIYKCIIDEGSIKNFFSNIKIKDVVISLFLIIAPYAIYMIDNYLQTGNPIFPFFNNIFKSDYYQTISAYDTKFGGQNFVEKIFWPIICVLSPERATDSKIVDFIWFVGYIVCIFSLFVKNKKIKENAILAIVCSLLWSFVSNGYTRYVLIIPVLYYIVIIQVLVNEINNIIFDKKIFQLLISISYTLFIVISLGISIMEGTVSYIHWINVRYNTYLESDDASNEKYDIDGVWGIINHNSAMPLLIRNEEDPIYNLDLEYGIDGDRASGYTEKQRELLYEKIKDKKIYVITALSDYKETIQIINDREVYKINYDNMVKYTNSKLQNKNDYWIIIELEYIGD